MTPALVRTRSTEKAVPSIKQAETFTSITTGNIAVKTWDKGNE